MRIRIRSQIRIRMQISTLEPCRRRTCGKRVRSTLSFYFLTFIGHQKTKIRKCQRRHGKIPKCYDARMCMTAKEYKTPKCCISFLLGGMRFHVGITLRPQTANPPWQRNFVRRIHDDTEASNDESTMVLRPRTKNPQ